MTTAQSFAGVMHLPGVTRDEHRFGPEPHHVVGVFDEPLLRLFPVVWFELTLAAIAPRRLARGEPYTDPEDGAEHELFDGRAYDVRPLDVVRARYPRVTWTPRPLPGGDDVTTAAVGLFGVVDGACVAIIAACKPEGT